MPVNSSLSENQAIPPHKDKILKPLDLALGKPLRRRERSCIAHGDGWPRPRLDWADRLRPNEGEAALLFGESYNGDDQPLKAAGPNARLLRSQIPLRFAAFISRLQPGGCSHRSTSSVFRSSTESLIAYGVETMPYEFVVNNHSAKVDVPANMPLLWVIRDVLNLKGTKFGCGMALCGACTVLIDGEAARSCMTDVSSVAGKKITTIEGLSADGTHPLQLAWQELDVPQCGYCQAGQIMQAASLLAKTPRPTEAQIHEAMDGNLCRCGTYLRIREAIHRAAASAR